MKGYNEKEILRVARKRLACTVALAALSLMFIISAILMIALLGDKLLAFISAVVLIIIGLLLLFKETKKLSLISLFSANGTITKVELDVKGVNDMKTASFSVTRPKYSKYWRDEIRCRVYIQVAEKTYSYKLNNITKKQADYYEQKGEAMHIFATRFPVRLTPDAPEWLCPLCGEFNEKETSTCKRCASKIMKDE